jgi:hypothetical protein
MHRRKLNYLIMALYHLIYQSKATRPFSDVELKHLLETAREYNEQHGITVLRQIPAITPSRYFERAR